MLGLRPSPSLRLVVYPKTSRITGAALYFERLFQHAQLDEIGRLGPKIQSDPRSGTTFQHIANVNL